MEKQRLICEASSGFRRKTLRMPYSFTGHGSQCGQQPPATFLGLWSCPRQAPSLGTDVLPPDGQRKDAEGHRGWPHGVPVKVTDQQTQAAPWSRSSALVLVPGCSQGFGEAEPAHFMLSPLPGALVPAVLSPAGHASAPHEATLPSPSLGYRRRHKSTSACRPCPRGNKTRGGTLGAPRGAASGYPGN